MDRNWNKQRTSYSLHVPGREHRHAGGVRQGCREDTWSGKGNVASTIGKMWSSKHLSKANKGTHVRDTCIKHPVVQGGDVDIEEEPKTKTSSVRNGLSAKSGGNLKKRQDKKR